MRSYEVLSLEPHFDPDLRFRQYEADPITGKTILRLMEITNPTRDLAATLRSSKVRTISAINSMQLNNIFPMSISLRSGGCGRHEAGDGLHGLAGARPVPRSHQAPDRAGGLPPPLPVQQVVLLLLCGVLIINRSNQSIFIHINCCCRCC